MKLNLTQKFKDLEGKDMVDVNKPGDNKVITLYEVLRVASATELKEDTSGDSASTIETKMKNLDIYLGVTEAGPDCLEFEISAEEAVHLKNRVGKIYSVLIAGPTINMLDGREPYSRRTKK